MTDPTPADPTPPAPDPTAPLLQPVNPFAGLPAVARSKGK